MTSASREACVWAVVPARAFVTAKSRLAGALPADMRQRVARALLARVGDALRAAACIEGVVLATDDADLTRVCAPDLVRLDRSGETLAEVLTGAVEVTRNAGATHALVVMADLPLLNADDVGALLSRHASGRLVIAPDHRGRCTNALLVPLDTPLRLAFGTGDSFRRHRAAARAAGLSPLTVSRPGLLRDLDVADDLSGPVASWVAALAR